MNRNVDENGENLRRLAEFLRQSRSAVFFGGAGVSTESGVKDYRSEDGLYQTVREYGVSPEEILSHHFLLENPQVFYDFYRKYFLTFLPKPNAAHRALALLEERKMLKAVITQNIDGLHQAAGSRSVLELHGTIFRYSCTHCGKAFSFDEIRGTKEKVPHCDSCGALIRPDVVLYEESLDEDVVGSAVHAIANADLLIIGGTSLAVYPAASFLRFFRGEHVVLMNREETPFDQQADLLFRGKIGELFTALLPLLGLTL